MAKTEICVLVICLALASFLVCKIYLKTFKLRHVIFFTGLSMGPLIEMTLYIDTSILPTAILSTAFIFGCFTLSAIFSDRRQSLYIMGLASSASVLVLSLALMNIFLNSYLIYKVGIDVTGLLLLYLLIVFFSPNLGVHIHHFWRDVCSGHH